MEERGETMRRVLIVEDDPIIGFGLEDLLTESGFEIAGLAPTLEKALALIELGGCDAAILDANLDGVSASPAGTALTLRGLPYIVLSGYSAQQQGGAFAGAAEYLQKPCLPERLIAALGKLMPARYKQPGTDDR
jgi:DNA-binding response OmpR family regulator